MIHTPAAVAVPLRMDEDGAIRIGNTRITFSTIINWYKLGHTVEDLHEGYPTIPLSDLHAVIAYYLANKDMVDAYLTQEEREAEEIRAKIEASYTPEQKARVESVRQKVLEKRQSLQQK